MRFLWLLGEIDGQRNKKKNGSNDEFVSLDLTRNLEGKGAGKQSQSFVDSNSWWFVLFYRNERFITKAQKGKNVKINYLRYK